MDTCLTIAEIESQFESEWVLLAEPQLGSQKEILGGNVIAHSKDRDEIYRQAGPAAAQRFAIVYTGRLPKDAAIVL
jgi:hypothetical protein